MAENKSIILLKNGTVVSDSEGQVVDLLAFCRLLVEVRVKVPSNAGETLQLQLHGLLAFGVWFLGAG